MTSDGEVQGVGMLIASDNRTGRLVVLSPLEGGPADRAGVQSGDEVSLGVVTPPELGYTKMH